MSGDVPGWYPLFAVGLVSAVCAGLLALAGCGDDVLPEPGNAGEVCDQPGDCPSNSGGELSPKAGLWAGFGYGLNATPADDVGRNWEAGE